MIFLLQLDLACLPEGYEGPRKRGVVQLFYCNTDDGLCPTWEPFSGTHEARLVSELVTIKRPASVSVLEQRFILSWEKIKDTPSYQSLHMFGIVTHFDPATEHLSIRSQDPTLLFEGLDLDIGLDDEEPLISDANLGDKLGGWPAWQTNAQPPACPTCESPMALVMQLSSQANLRYMFGDAETGFLTQCPNHPEKMGFSWGD